jgi:hypothetical protein
MWFEPSKAGMYRVLLWIMMLRGKINIKTGLFVAVLVKTFEQSAVLQKSVSGVCFSSLLLLLLVMNEGKAHEDCSNLHSSNLKISLQ